MTEYTVNTVERKKRIFGILSKTNPFILSKTEKEMGQIDRLLCGGYNEQNESENIKI